jgi:hypothetical protein
MVVATGGEENGRENEDVVAHENSIEMLSLLDEMSGAPTWRARSR